MTGERPWTCGVRLTGPEARVGGVKARPWFLRLLALALGLVGLLALATLVEGLWLIRSTEELQRTSRIEACRLAALEEELHRLLRDERARRPEPSRTLAQELLSVRRELGRLERVMGVARAWPASWPSLLPVNGRIASSWGFRRHPLGGTGQEFHDGIDLAVPPGTAVRASGSGRVVFAGWWDGYGKFVLLDHGGGVRSFYGHNGRLLVQPGESVARGQVIAHSGNTGRSTGPHLHFGIHVGGYSVDPLAFLEAPSPRGLKYLPRHLGVPAFPW